MTTNTPPRYLSFEGFRLDCRSGELRRNQREIKLQPQPAKLLVLLATRRGETVTREEIQKELWGDDTFVDFEHGISSVAVSPDSKWIASGSEDGTIRLWPMPEETPFHTLPYEEILERLRALTIRVVPDKSSDGGYRVEIDPFPGCKKLPSW